jgi:hypothetical protein
MFLRGTYRVPAEMPFELAEKALRTGIAEKSMPVLSIKNGSKKKNATAKA